MGVWGMWVRRGGCTGLGGQRHSHTGPLRDRQRAASAALCDLWIFIGPCVAECCSYQKKSPQCGSISSEHVRACVCYEVKLYASPVTADGLVIIATACKMAVAIII